LVAFAGSLASSCIPRKPRSAPSPGKTTGTRLKKLNARMYCFILVLRATEGYISYRGPGPPRWTFDTARRAWIPS
jgi:hypothetical protein